MVSGPDSIADRLDLAQAVDRLTEPRRRKVLTPTDKHPGLMQTVLEESLITRLRHAIAHSMVGPGGTSDPAERAPINPLALDLYRRLEDRIASLAAERGIVALYSPEGTLREWLTAFIRSNPDDEEIEHCAHMVTAWVAEVERMLNPPVTLPLTVPCIRCGAHDHYDRARATMGPAVVVEYHLEQEDSVADIRTVCRVCAAVWRGAHAAHDFAREADRLKRAAERYEVEVPDERGMSQADAFGAAEEALSEIGRLWGKVLLLQSATPTDRRYRFAGWVIAEDHPVGVALNTLGAPLGDTPEPVHTTASSPKMLG